ncbi:hypothetical protein Glove_726g1 [Diversispora epigaea]|uniref:Protein kinase domain-containing protein n=1 Tax=Diversispora epigaea TaxID=1348612 RepID=A0A397G2X8_9GLOM|nr:hypothetical protein Glove_726g1 [Diversispora epigaea]
MATQKIDWNDKLMNTWDKSIGISKYLENNFGNWTSGNYEIGKLIQECQQTTVKPDSVIEWINHDQFENVKFLANGGCAIIYTANWRDRSYDEWNSERQILERSGGRVIVLKRLNNSNSNNVRWFQEMALSFTLDNTSIFLVSCYGITKGPITQDYMLVLDHYTMGLNKIHEQNIIHRDLHSGNILNSVQKGCDLGLSGPVDKPLNSIGNLPYVAPELLYVYSLGIIMWEVITCETPFSNHKINSNSDFALTIINGYRPEIYKYIKYIPYEYATLMKQS